MLRWASAGCFVVAATLVLPANAAAQLVMGSGRNAPAQIRIIDPATGFDRSFSPYPGFFRGVRVALGDVNGDGVLDIVTGPGPGGGPHVQVFDGVTLQPLASFYAYHPAFAGGVFVAAGDVNGDGRADIITGAGPGGGPHVLVFSGANLSVLASFYAYDPRFPGGVSVAAGDVNGDGKADIITGAGVGGGPHVVAYSGADLHPLASFYAFSPSFPGGVNVAAGDVNGDGKADIITGAGPGGDPLVRVFSGANLGQLAEYFAYDPVFSGGVVVTAGDFNQDGTVDVITGPGRNGGPHVKVFSGTDNSVLASFMAFAGGGGAFVGANAERSLRFTSPPSTTVVAGTPTTFTITTAGNPPPTLTVGGTLPAGVTFVDNGNGTAALAGTPAAGTGGVYPLTLTATNGVRAPVTQNFTLTVNEPLVITSADSVTLTTGAPGSFMVTTTGFPVPTLTIGGVALPAGVTFVDNGDGTGTLSGTPAAGTGGTYALTFTAANTVGTPVVQNFTLTVSGVPTFTSANTATFTVGSAGTFTVTTVGTPAAALSVAGTLPAGMTFVDSGNGTGTLGGTPAAATGGPYPLTFTATNTVGSATQSFTLTVLEGPAVTSTASTLMLAGAAGSFTVTTTGLPVPSLTVGGTLPGGVTFVDNGNGTGTLSGIPAALTGGIYTLQFTATNSVGSSAPQAFTFTVNQAPLVTSAATTAFAAGVAGLFMVTTSAFPLPIITITGTLPGGVTFADNLNGTGTFSGTPAAGTAGAYTFTITISNGVGSPLAHTFTLNVDEGPVITSASSTTFAIGAINSFTVAASGFPRPTLVQGGATLPAGVTFVDNGDGTGTLSGTPEAGTGGDYALTFTASNVRGSAVQNNFTLTVSGSPGFTSAATTTITVGTPGTFTVTAIGTPAPAITVGGALPAGVTFVDNGGGSGTLSGTPAAGTGGTYALTFTAANGVLPDGTQAFTLNVNDGPAITSAASATFTIGTLGSFTVTTSGLPLPALAIGGVALPAGVTFVDNGNGTGTLSGTPAAGTGGTYAISFTATNTIGSSAPQAFTLTVSGPPSITSANTTTFTAGTPGSFTVTAIGSPTPAIVVSGSLPAGVTFVDNGGGSGTLSGTPGAATGGSYALTFTASNGVLPDGTQTFTLIVNQAPAVTSAATATFTVGSAGTFSVTTSGFPLPTLARGGVALPAGVTFADNGNGTGTLSGTAAAGTGGTYAISFTATNTAGASAPQAFTLTVNEVSAITSANTVSFTAGVAGTFTVTTLGFPVPTIARGGVALPSGVTFVDSGTGSGTLSGTPAAGTGGSYAITFTATNSGGSSPVQGFTLNVNQPPAITSANATSFLVGTPGSFTVTATGFPVPTLTLTTGTLPAGITFTDNGNGTATLSGTPTATGAFALAFTAANSAGAPAVQSFTLTVNQAPSFTSAASTTFTEDVPGTFTVTTLGTPTPALSVTGALPNGVTFTDIGNGTATLAGTPAAGGTFPLTISANNGVGSPVAQAFTLTVNEVNDAPSFVLASAPPAVAEDAGPQTVAAFATLISAGPANEAGQVLTFVVQNNSNPALFSIPPVVSVTTGALTYTSGANAFGTATITLVLQDNGGTANGGVNTSAPQMFTITVLPVNDPPLVVNETFELLGNTELRVDMPAGTTPHTSDTTTGVSVVEGVLDNDGDPEGDPIAVTAIANCTLPDTTAPFDCTLTGGAVVHVAANGEFSYTPAPGATTGSFTYTVTDTPAQGTAASVNGTVTFTIVEMVWYVRNDAAAGNGTSRAPLNALTTLNGAGGAGDVDDGNDYIFVDFGDGTSTGQVGGLELEAGQQLIGEFVGLSIPVNLNGNGSPTVVVPPPAATDCSGGPCRPLLSHATGNALSLTEAMAATIRGFRLAGGSAGNAIDVTTDGALTGSATLTIADNVFQGAGLEGLDVNLIAGTTGTLALTVLGNIWDNTAAHGGNAIDISRLAGALNLTLSSNLNIESALNAVVINGGSAASTNIIGFANNTVHTDTLGAGMIITNVTFDAVPGGVVDPVAGGVLTIGVDGNGVGGSGLTLTSVQGNLGFTDLDVYGGTTGLSVTGDATLGVVLTVVPPGSGGSSETKGANGAAVTISNAAINLQLAELASTFAAGSGVSLTTVSGTFTVPSGSTIVKNGGGGAAFTVNNSTAGTTVLTATYAGTITNTSGTGGSVSVTSADAGSSVSFTGAITDNPGTGILLASNTGATVSFSGGLTLNGAASVFTATGGGTVSVTGTNTIGATTAATTTALTVTSTAIAAGGLTFRSISAGTGVGSAGNGIILDNTGTAAANGGLTITGTGTAGSGGTIQRKTGANGSTTQGIGIYLNQTKNASFASMQLNNFDNFAIRANEVNGLTLSSVVVSGLNGNDAGSDEGSVLVEDSGGSIAITNSNISGGFEDNLRVDYNNGVAGPAAIFNVSGSSFHDLQAAGQNAQVNLRSQTAASSGWVAAFNFTSNTFENDANTLPPGGTENWSDGILVTFEGPFAHDLTIENSTFHHLFQGLDIASNFSADVDYVIRNNNITFTEGVAAIAIGNGSSSTAQSFLTALIQGNTIGTSGVAQSGSRLGQGIVVDVRGQETAQFTIHGNTIRRIEVGGIDVLANTGDGDLHIQITNNVIDQVEDDVGGGISDGMRVLTGTGSLHDICLDARSNDSFKIGAGSGDELQIRQVSNDVVFQIEGLTGSGTNAANVESYLDSQNPLFTPADGGTRVRTVASVVNFTSVAACTTPPIQ